MSTSEALALGLAIAAVLLVAGVVQLIGAIHRRKLDERRPDYEALSRRLGFELQQQRWLFDTHVARLVGTRGDLEILLEIDHSEELSYRRLWIDFPVPLDMGFRIMTEADESVWSRLMSMREIEIGAPSFDPHFLLLARDDERVGRLLDQDVRRMFLDLYNVTEFIAVDDDAMTLLMRGELSDDQMSDFMDTAARLATRLARGADEIHDEDRAERESTGVTSAFTPVPGDIQAVSGASSGGEA
jgi:hypothetical protein